MKHVLLTLALSMAAVCTFAQKTSVVKMATYNVDGLPSKLMGININTDGPGDKYSSDISQRLEESGWNIIGLNEDFNSHDAIISKMTSYDFQKYTGEITVSMEAIIGALRKTWRFECDGLELATTKGYKVSNETIVPWNNDAVYGYYDHENDSLTKKGFRYYTVTTTDGYSIDVMILHADAGEEQEDVNARENAMSQLYDFITTDVKTNNPLVIMGDYNCLYAADRLQELFIDRINKLPGCIIEDAGRKMGATEDLDKILYMNRNDATFTLQPTSAELVNDFTREDGTQLSDHHPMCATFDIVENVPSGITNINAESEAGMRKYLDNGRIVIKKNNHRYTIEGQVIE